MWKLHHDTVQLFLSFESNNLFASQYKTYRLLVIRGTLYEKMLSIQMLDMKKIFGLQKIKNSNNNEHL